MNELYGEDYERFKLILLTVKESGSFPRRTKPNDRFNIAYLISLDMLEWEEDPMANFAHLTQKGQEWLESEKGRNERYRR